MDHRTWDDSGEADLIEYLIRVSVPDESASEFSVESDVQQNSDIPGN